jgi:hypothetical protein
MVWSPGKIFGSVACFASLRNASDWTKHPQLNKRAYQYKLDRVLRAPMNLIMNMVEMILSVNALNWPFSLRGRILRSILKNR